MQNWFTIFLYYYYYYHWRFTFDIGPWKNQINRKIKLYFTDTFSVLVEKSSKVSFSRGLLQRLWNAIQLQGPPAWLDEYYQIRTRSVDLQLDHTQSHDYILFADINW